MRLKKNNDRLLIENREKGSAMVVSLLVMILLLGFVGYSLIRTSNETIASSNDASESRAYEAANAGLEVITRNFQKIFDTKLSPDDSDLTLIEGQDPPGFEGYDITSKIKLIGNTRRRVVVGGGEFKGMNALRDEWIVNTKANDLSSGVEVELKRRFFNDRIPIFQFGIFYDDDLEFHPGPRFNFGGRVHSNSHIFFKSSGGLYFNSKVSAHKKLITDVMKGGSGIGSNDDKVFIKNDANQDVQLKHNMGSSLAGGTGVVQTNAPAYPVTKTNPAWLSTNKALFGGNLLDEQSDLKLPLKINSAIKETRLTYIELIKRGKTIGDRFNNGTGTVAAPNIIPVVENTADDEITKKERYYNKAGIRVSLADRKNLLPGCAEVLTACGIRLNGHENGQGADANTDLSKGYKPRAMGDGYQATRINGERFSVGTREAWIKIETVGFNASNVFESKDITEDILSLGVTERARPEFNLDGYSNADSRSVIKLQRFSIDGEAIAAATSRHTTSSTLGSTVSNYVLVKKGIAPLTKHLPEDDASCTNPSVASKSCYTKTITLPGPINVPVTYGDHEAHWKKGNFESEDKYIVPFPINMFDTREGLNYERNDSYNYDTIYNPNNVPWSGVMSMIDIDVANMRAFLKGDYDSNMPNGTSFGKLKSTDILNSDGWVVYVSDRRGDFDFDGKYDMEDVFGESGNDPDVVKKNTGNDGNLQPGEDVNGDNILNIDGVTTGEAIRYRGGAGFYPANDLAAVSEHQFYRRGVRLINGERVPGKYDLVTPGNTQGFTVASENGVYVKGNYNATGISDTGNTPSTNYLPQDTEFHIPASIAADAVIILSKDWNDTKSFKNPFTLGSRVAGETTVRFAMLSGDTITTVAADPNQGGGDPRLGGGVHNFKRFLEDWKNSTKLNYSGSIINLYNSNNNNGTFKCCRVIYSPPVRNWVFDTTFNDPDRLPPGTPFFQEIKLTGFQRIN